MRRALASLALLAGFASAPRAGADPCPVPEGAAAALAGLDAAPRLAFLSAQAATDDQAARAWSRDWLAACAALAVAQLVPLQLVDRPSRPDLVVGAATSLLGVGLLLATPLHVSDDAPTLRLAAAQPGCPSLATAEPLFLRDAAEEAQGRSALAHAGNVLVNLLAGLVLGLGYHRWTSAAVAFASGTALGELMLRTRPATLPDALSRYLAGQLTAPPAR